MDSAENIPSSPPKTEVFSLLLFIRQNDTNADFIPCVNCNFTSFDKSRNFKNFTNSEKYFCDFILRFINVGFFGDYIQLEKKRGFHQQLQINQLPLKYLLRHFRILNKSQVQVLSWKNFRQILWIHHQFYKKFTF